jgi:hypothetical protein
MTIQENKIAGTLDAKKMVAPVSTWKKSPGDKMAACEAALHYARKYGVKMVCVPGNSYMRAVYHIVVAGHELRQLTARKTNELTGMVVYPSGEVYNATLTD